MFRYIIISITSGILFGVLDGIINANPFARRLFDVYKPIAKTTVNVAVGIIIDLLYGFVMAALFLLLYQSLPGANDVMKGISFALIVWFFRVVMGVVTQWMRFKVPLSALYYILFTGLCELLVLGILYGLTLKPTI